MCQDQRLLQPAGGRTLCRAASVCSSPPPSHLHLIENIIGASVSIHGCFYFSDYNFFANFGFVHEIMIAKFCI